MKKITVITLWILFSFVLSAQTPCTEPGQNPSTAFPVCGTTTFTKLSVPLCGGRSLPSPACKQDGVTDRNPFWYKFTCYQSGSLGFVITPKNMDDDYDWELYDVTGKDPNDIYTNQQLVIASNWSGEPGETGASSTGSQQFVCGGFGKPLYSKMPALLKGHDYILLLSHFTQTQSGYDLSFKGGTAVITDTTLPRLKSITASCGGDVLRIKLNKNIKCNSIAADGSDFYLSPAGASIDKSVGINCTAKFDTDSLQLHLSQFLAPGTYTLRVKKGTDGNTLLDYCDLALPETELLQFTIQPRQPASLDSLGGIQCAPRQVKVYLNKPILCSSLAPNGSDFRINGPYAVAITAAAAGCSGSLTKEVLLSFSAPLEQEGNFTISVAGGNDGNTLLDECGTAVPVGTQATFAVKDTVNARFSYTIQYGCSLDTVNFAHAGGNGVNSWTWDLDDGKQSNQQRPTAYYTLFNQKKVTLIVSNGFCKDTSTATIALTNFLKADFTVFEDNCPAEPIQFTGQAQGTVVQHHWSFGDGAVAALEAPTHTYLPPVQQQSFPVRYTVTDNRGCQSTAEKRITIYSSCYLAVPTAFSPNKDGKNDYLYPLNAIKAEQLEFRVYNRWGQLLFKTNNWKKGWDGKFEGKEQGTGVYIWQLSYRNRDTGKTVEQKGTAVLIR